MIEKIKKYKFSIGIILISLIYFILTSVQSLRFGYPAVDDDYYILHSAMSILEFHWMGGFQGRTLSKGPGASIFIAISNAIGLTLTQAQFLLYIGASILFVYVLKKVIKSDLLRIIIFCFILFNPLMYSDALLSVYRDNVNCSFLLYVISCIFGIFFNYKEDFKKIIPYMIGFGIFGSWMAITREETIWISPLIICNVIITCLFIIFDKECLQKKKKILLYIIPISIYIVVILVICTFNKIAYGEFVRIEQNTRAYKSFIKAISSVDVKKPDLTVPVPKEAREKLYEVSPAFSELKDTFDGASGNNLSKYGRNSNEIETGWLMWTVFAALNEHGYSVNLKTFNDYLRRATSEINEAYKDGRLKKEDNPASIFDKNNFGKLLESMNNTFEFQTEMTGVAIKLGQDTYFEGEHDPNVPEVRKEEFQEITGNLAVNSVTYNYGVDKIKIKILTKISDIYKDLNKPVFFICLAVYFLMILRFFLIKSRFANYKELIILTSLIMLYFIRIVVVAYVDTAMCPAINVLYLASAYSLQFTFEILTLAFFVIGISDFVKKVKLKKA